MAERMRFPDGPEEPALTAEEVQTALDMANAESAVNTASRALDRDTVLYGITKGLTAGVLLSGSAFTGLGINALHDGDTKIGVALTALGVGKCAIGVVFAKKIKDQPKPY